MRFWFLMLLAVMSSAAEARERNIGRWLVIDGPDPITDKPRVMLIISPTGDRSSAFRLHCEKGVPGYGVLLSGKTFKDGDILDIVLRVDSHPATQATVNAHADSGLVIGSLSRLTYLRMIAAKKIAAQIYFGGSVMTQVFDLGETKKVMPIIRSICPPESVPEGNPKLFDADKPFVSLASEEMARIKAQSKTPEPVTTSPTPTNPDQTGK